MLVVVIVALVISGCDFKPVTDDQHSYLNNYPACLYSALQGAHSLTADDIRSLCEEITGVAELVYHYDTDGTRLLPVGEFMACYVDEEERLGELGLSEADANRLAKLSCKYPNAKNNDVP
jgi:hypothetical protein